MWFTITVPQNCQLRFENTFVVVLVREKIGRYNASVALTGPSFEGGRVELTLGRTSGGVEISG